MMASMCGNEICFEANGCNTFGCGPEDSCLCTSQRGSGAGFCFSQGCGAPCESSLDCVDGDGNQIGLCSDNTGGCCTPSDCILFENIDVCGTSSLGKSQQAPLPRVER
jgi:hypothetical protein